jgi:hypothetical protein
LHAVERPNVTVFFTPEIPGPMATIHAGWAADDGYETCPFLTKEEAMAFASKRYGVTWGAKQEGPP